MNYRTLIGLMCALTILMVLLAGCNSPRQSNDIVTAALNKYKVGKTTLADLKNDSGMVKVDVAAPSNFPPKSYLNPMPSFFKMKDGMTYILPPGSAWKIYGLRQNTQTRNGESQIAWSFLIGNTNRPIRHLEFDFENVLSKITVVTNYVPPAELQFLPKITQASGVALAADSSAHVDGAGAQPSPPVNIEELARVAKALQTYQCDKTTIQDFVRDSKLINLSHPELNTAVISSNLPSLTMERMIRSSYQIPKGSLWKVYESSHGSSKAAGDFWFKYRWKYVVGDVNKPICILSFDEEGTLKEKTAVMP